MPARSTPLNNYPVLHSRDPEFVRERLLADFGATRFDVATGRDKFAVRANHLQIGGLGLSYCDYTGDVSLGFEGASFVRQLFNISGTGKYQAGGPPGEIATGSWSSILPAHEPVKLDVRTGYRQLVLRIELDSLRRYLSALLGQQLGKELEFETTTYAPSMNSLRRRVFQFAADFNERGAYFSDLAAAEIERMLVMNFLMCHRHNYTHLLQRQPLPVAPSSVRTVEEYIEANWDKAVDIQIMAQVAGVSARSLFRQFKKERGYSPADFAKRIRLDRARGLLEQSGRDTSVIQTALKCGFQNPGHFARDFRLAFGELPSETLKKSARGPHSRR
jgi:AraC-like DNA-binding protein